MFSGKIYWFWGYWSRWGWTWSVLRLGFYHDQVSLSQVMDLYSFVIWFCNLYSCWWLWWCFWWFGM